MTPAQSLRPPTQGILVHADGCELVGDLLHYDAKPVTGTVANKVDGDSSRLRLDVYSSGKFEKPFKDTLLGMNTSACSHNYEHSYMAGMRSDEGSMIYTDNSLKITRLAGSTGSIGFWPDGSVAELCGFQAYTPDRHAVQCFWNWHENGVLNVARCIYGLTHDPASNEPIATTMTTFDIDGLLTDFSFHGDVAKYIAPAELGPNQWVLRSLEDLFALEVSDSISLPHDQAIETEILKAAPTWLQQVHHLDFDSETSPGMIPERNEVWLQRALRRKDGSGLSAGWSPERDEFTRRLIEATNIASIKGGSLGRPSLDEAAIRRLVVLAKEFVSADKHRVAELDGCRIASIDGSIDSITTVASKSAVSYTGALVFDENMQRLLAIDAPFLRDIYVESMVASPILEFVRITAGDSSKTREALEEVRQRRPNCIVLDDGARRNLLPSDAFLQWLGNRRPDLWG